tara:strand:+ start:357 stop:950 length:594 start_codon:yes stop_codon:yes gene_type:complete
MMMKPVFHSFEPSFNKHRNTPNIEIEFRLGKKGNGFFDTNVGEDTFFKLKKALDRFEGWENVTESSHDVYYGSKGKRTHIDSITEEQTTEIKSSLVKLDHISKDLPFDIRMAVSTEIPTEQGDDETYEEMKKKNRTSYVRKGLQIDMSMISGNPEDMDDEEDMSYQVEFEIQDPKQVDNRDKLYNHIHKIKDLLDCL